MDSWCDVHAYHPRPTTSHQTMDEQQKQAPWQRYPAVKTWIWNLLQGRHIPQEGAEPMYVLAGRQKILRANLFGVIVSKDETPTTSTIIIDDGSGKIMVRSFDNPALFSSYPIGEIINLIGRPREFMNEVYLVPEIIKKIDNPALVELRKMELASVPRLEAAKEQREQARHEQQLPIQETSSAAPMRANEEIDIADTTKGKKNDMVSIIRELDTGGGAELEEVLQKTTASNAQVLLNSLILSGDVFEVRPGRLKVLE